MNQLSVSVMPVNKTTMTSREISELVGSRHDHVKTSVDRLAASGLISSPPLRDSYKDSTGRMATQYLVGKRDSYVIVAQLSPSFTAALVDRWQALEAQQAQALPQTYHAALLSLTEEVGKRIALEAQATIDAPKVEFAMAVRRMDGACKVGDFAKVIGFGRNNLFEKLRLDEILMADNMPYQRYIDRGFFVVIEQVPFIDRSGKAHPAFTTMVTGKGQVWLERKYRNIDNGQN
jgi:anti-repressor protein